MKPAAGWFWLFIALAMSSGTGISDDTFAYLEETDPFYPHLDFPKLITPQWIGEPGVEAVVILAIDDMRAPERYETFLRPILDRLKQIDGRAPVSIYCNALDPSAPQLTRWLDEGLSLEVHTLSHPCPLLAKGDWAAAWDTYHGCVDLLSQVPGNRPVAFRMPCCDSMNSPSPRFFTEMFGRASAAGNFLAIDSSVMNITTTNDPALPRELVLDAQGRPRFAKYLPSEPGGNVRVGMGSFVTTIEDYPYPYIIGGVCWEFPAMVPSDWEAQNLHGTNNPITVEDWLAGLEVAVRKQGTFTFIFHPHGWIRADQMVEFIDQTVVRYGARVKFLTFREAAQRLNQHLLLDHPLRGPAGHDHGVRLLDLNKDGYLDVLAGAGSTRWTRVWEPTRKTWTQTGLPVVLRRAGDGADRGVRFGRVDGAPVLLVRNEEESGAWRFENGRWLEVPHLLNGLDQEGQPLWTSRHGRDLGVRLRDVTGDGQSELLVFNAAQQRVWTWQTASERWTPLACTVPNDIRLTDETGQDAGLRFVDVNADGHDDLIFSDSTRYSVDLFVAQPRENLGFSYGWSFRVREGDRSNPRALPMISRGGPTPNNGAWFRRGYMWVQNEDTAHLPDKVDRRPLQDLIQFDVPAARTPEESLQAMAIPDGYTVELIAAEPLVEDPVAFEWGEDGRLWVAEMSDYPAGADTNQPGGRVRVLTDTDQDGRYDRAEVFLDGLNFPTGVMPWRNGVLVSAAPEIFYAEDRDGDGRADVRVTLMQGFGQGNQQHRVNGFELGLDNWVYAANGDSGGLIQVVGRVPAASAETAVINGNTFQLRGHDLRFRPDDGRAEPVAGQTQFGRRRDDWGNWFGNNNPNWGWHYWIEERYLARNPDLPVRSAVQHLPDYDNKARVFAISEEVVRFNWPGGFNQVTSANSPTPYRDDIPQFANTLFISEPANNVIHREILEPRGASFRSRRPPSEEQSEFVASRDVWFRPTMLKTGPDGALYVADMYRLVIEHPEYALPGIERSIDIYAGKGQGRIYRIYPKDVQPRPFHPLNERSTAQLVSALNQSNGWTRDTAHRLLLHRADPSAAQPLRGIVREGSDPRSRLQALCVLDGLGLLDPGSVLTALKDNHPSVREHAVRVSEDWLRRGQQPEILDALLNLTADPAPRVRFQLALSLGETLDARAAPALLGLLIRDGEDSQLRTAALSSSRPHAAEMLEAALTGDEAAQPWIEPLTVLSIASGQTAAISRALDRLTMPTPTGEYAAWQLAGLASFLQNWRRQGGTAQTLAQHWQQAPEKLSGLLELARRLAAAPTEQATRLVAIRLLAQGTDPDDLNVLSGLLGARQSPNLEAAAVDALAQRPEPGVADALLRAWPGLGPQRRAEILNTLLSREAWTRTLLERVSEEVIPANQVSVGIRQRLLNHERTAVRAQATQLFGSVAPERAQLLERYAPVTHLTPVLERGAQLFALHCATCHRLANDGVELGPDLTAISDPSVPSLLVAILDPNRAVDPAYVNYAAALKDGRELEGLIVAETANNITLRGAGGTESLILRNDLEELRSLGLSLMPEGMEHALDPQQMADLIGYVRRFVKVPKD